MIIKKLEDATVVDDAHHCDVRNLYSKETLSVTVITLEPGKSLKKHITPVDVAFCVLAGEGVVEIGDEQMPVGSGTLVESPKGIVHCWHNRSRDLLRFMVIKAPRPIEATVFMED